MDSDEAPSSSQPSAQELDGEFAASSASGKLDIVKNDAQRRALQPTSSTAGLKHPYRQLPQQQPPRPIYKVIDDVAILHKFKKNEQDRVLRELQRAIDAGAMARLSRDELAQVAFFLRSKADEIVLRCAGINDHASWVAGSFFSVSLLLAIIKLPHGISLLVVALIFMASTRVLVMITKRWLAIAQKLCDIATSVSTTAQGQPGGDAPVEQFIRPFHELPSVFDESLRKDMPYLPQKSSDPSDAAESSPPRARKPSSASTPTTTGVARPSKTKRGKRKR